MVSARALAAREPRGAREHEARRDEQAQPQAEDVVGRVDAEELLRDAREPPCASQRRVVTAIAARTATT
jgi:hypothetical protein